MSIDTPEGSLETKDGSDIRVLDGPTRSARASWVNDKPAGVALGAFVLASGLSLGRIFTDTGWVAPVLVVVLGTFLVCVLLRRLAIRSIFAVPISAATTVVLSAWTLFPLSTVLGIPRLRTWYSVGNALVSAANSIHGAAPPVHSTKGYLLVAVWAAGVVVILSDWAAFRARSSIEGLAPGFALFILCSTLSGASGRGITILFEVVTGLVYLAAHQSSVSLSGSRWMRSAGSSSVRSSLTALVPIGAVAAVAAFVSSLVLPPADGVGVIGWRHPVHYSPAATVPDPMADLRTRLIHESDTEVFSVRSTLPSYWALTSLEYFNGVQWNQSRSKPELLHYLPTPAVTPPVGTQNVIERFTIHDLQSPWLPFAFQPVSVSGVSGVAFDPSTVSLIGPRSTSNGLKYRVVAIAYTDGQERSHLMSAPKVNRRRMSRFLQLPASVPPSVKALARRITAGDRTEVAKALALQDFFYGPSFHYSLHPPPDGNGTDALTNFLFKTRTGFCQQFAGAYGVMARSIGLPTVLSVGFTTGRPVGHDTYRVTDADAHVWPLVYFPNYGWVPFEPTSGASFHIPGSVTYPSGNRYGPSVERGAGHGPRGARSVTNPNHVLPHGRHVSPNLRPPLGVGPAGHISQHGRHQGAHTGLSAGVVFATLALSFPVWLLAGLLIRRARRRRIIGAVASTRSGAPHDSPDYPAGQVLARWVDLCDQLQAWHLDRHGHETNTEFATRAAARLDFALGAKNVGERMEAIAVLADEASFTPGQMDPSSTKVAEDEFRAVVNRLRYLTPLRTRIAYVVDPHLVWGPDIRHRDGQAVG